MGLVGSYAPCCLCSLYSVVAGQRADTWVRPYTGIGGWLAGRVSLWRNWSVFRVGVAAYPLFPSTEYQVPSTKY
jgi:hypothetical protein